MQSELVAFKEVWGWVTVGLVFRVWGWGYSRLDGNKAVKAQVDSGHVVCALTISRTRQLIDLRPCQIFHISGFCSTSPVASIFWLLLYATHYAPTPSTKPFKP